MIPIPSSRPASPSGQPECSVQVWRGCPTFVAWAICCLAAMRGDRYSRFLRSGLGWRLGGAPKESDPPGPFVLLWVTRRRFDPSSSPSANLPKVMSSPGGPRLALERNFRSCLEFECWTPDRLGLSIILQRSRFSPNLWTLPIRYGFQNSIIPSYL
jgi:hypothetical protein